jgi:DNA-binding Lrp family transcriptional regulator
MVVSVLRKFFSRLSGEQQWDEPEATDYLKGVGLGHREVDYDEIAANLEVRRLELEQMMGMLVSEVKESYSKIVESIRGGDRESAELLAAEVAMKNTLIKALAMVSKLLKLAVSKIKTAKSVEELAKVLGPAVIMLRNINEYMVSMAPEVAAQLSAIKDEIEKLYAIPGINLEHMRIRGITDLVPESKEVLRKAYEEASKDLERILPPPPAEAREVKPVDLEELQEKLLQYIRERGGRISIKRAAEDLGVSPEVVRKALFRLEERGIIRLHGPAREGQQA